MNCNERHERKVLLSNIFAPLRFGNNRFLHIPCYANKARSFGSVLQILDINAGLDLHNPRWEFALGVGLA